MRTILLSIILSVAVAAQTKPVEPKAEHAITDKQKADFYLAQLKVAQQEITVLKAQLEALNKLLMDQPTTAVTESGKVIAAACPTVTMAADGRIECPKEEAKK